ncbi:hypothetical protein SPBR_08365 [Sporothrix brasiliensis 5110]|uniref:Uncharacterized protein n=1 Tax=Sporothrix brasiliensis 5110 TaxID=1398154 RepID=A0A0C2IB96_9PEZI|nr:uncharacterized protein SPBR_08365 [Sporothrix brasiliensis 5110]KIH86521.1 hypothetical protein SPBR_08365 [Sporothrix brasiliensis 5110]
MAGFMFVNGRQNDRSTQRRMRQHVMQGKNAGKTLHRPSRQLKAVRRGDTAKQGATATSTSSSCSSSSLFSLTEPLDILKRLPPVTAFYAAIDSPVAMTSFALQVIDASSLTRCSGDARALRLDFNGTVERVYAHSFGVTSASAKPLWFQFIFADEAAYHCTLALMQASNEVVLGSATGCVVASSSGASGDSAASGDRSVATYGHYVAESLRQLKTRLDGPDALANSTIQLVLMFISQEQMRHASRNARVHLAGLAQMVALRGGLAAFETRPADRPLLLKICKIDIVYALQFGAPPLFYRDVLASVVDQLDIGGRCVRAARDTAVTHHAGLALQQPGLYALLCDVLAVSLLFEKELPRRPIDVFTFGDIFSSLCYRLLRMGRETFRADSTGDLYHLGMTMFAMALFLRFDQRRLLGYQLIGKRFRAVVEDDPGESRRSERSEDPDDIRNDEICFWVVMMGGMWTQGNWSKEDCPGRTQKARKVRKLADRLGIATWENARTVLDKYPCLTVLHSQPGLELWEASREAV